MPVSLPLSAIKRYERPLSAVSMVAGFAFDNYFFGRVDHPATQIVLFAYLLGSALSILLLHHVESAEEPHPLFVKARPLFVMGSQFAFGSLWSAFLIFYSRSAVLSASWPFLIVLAGVFVGNEVFRDYHSRLAFACTLLFFAFFSYAIFIFPMFTGTMGRRIFLMSGGAAVAAYATILFVLWGIGAERIRAAWRSIAIGAVLIYGSLNLFYFTNILPPLPLALARAGVFHSVTKTGDVYRAIGEAQPWYSMLSASPVVHIARGEPLSLYGAVFAPIQLKTNIQHVWQRYDQAEGSWRTESVVSFPITGGREGGYRGYSIKSAPREGRWRVNIATQDGLLIGRVSFSVLAGAAAGATIQQIIR